MNWSDRLLSCVFALEYKHCLLAMQCVVSDNDKALVYFVLNLILMLVLVK